MATLAQNPADAPPREGEPLGRTRENLGNLSPESGRRTTKRENQEGEPIARTRENLGNFSPESVRSTTKRENLEGGPGRTLATLAQNPADEHQERENHLGEPGKTKIKLLATLTQNPRPRLPTLYIKHKDP